jgi:lipopolysaccharide export system permease protein
MKILDRYIGKVILVSVLLTLFVFTALNTFFEFIAELDDIGKGRYDFLEATLYVALLIPRHIHEYFPVATLVGAIIGLGTLSSSSELTVIRTAGVSIQRIILSALKIGVVLMVIMVLIGEFVAPYGDQYASMRRSIAISDQIALRTKHGFWSRDGMSYINIRTIKPGGVIGDIYLYEFDDDHRLRVITKAEKAVYRNKTWVLENIVQTQVSEQQVTNQQIASAEWSSLLSPAILSVLVVKPEKMSAMDLYRYIQFLHRNNQAADRFEVAFWNKILLPLSTAVMIFIAVPFVCGPLRRVSVGARIVVGVLFGVVFFVINQAFSHLGVAYQISPLLGAMIPTTIFMVIGIIMLRRSY